MSKPQKAKSQQHQKMYLSPNIPFPPPPESKGKSEDFIFLKEDQWLMDTEVKYKITMTKSQWHLTMIYIDIHNPLRFIQRKIDRYHSEKKAKIYAQILQRGIRKDARGILKTNKYAIRLYDN